MYLTILSSLPPSLPPSLSQQLGAAQAAFIEWKSTESAFEAQRRHVQQMVESAATQQVVSFSFLFAPP